MSSCSAGSVILDGPVLPSTEGDNVTLSCRCKGPAAAEESCAPAEFYRDGVWIRTSTTADMTLHNFSWSDQGVYWCKVNGVGESPESWLAVRGTEKLILSVWFGLGWLVRI